MRDPFHLKTGHLPGNDYPLAIVQVDHTPCQICFVDKVARHNRSAMAGWPFHHAPYPQES
ncbi:hypothetical protein CPter91_5205 [Collimonas pratensis]|uniref:Uncharacterized protein n=1 Tax=Collimonas pratensis TaxID=279113 RepID=A0A127QBP8_9BURK|nr:hypothetical protein CPter91_5205 [Collimonas pratensis]